MRRSDPCGQLSAAIPLLCLFAVAALSAPFAAARPSTQAAPRIVIESPTDGASVAGPNVTVEITVEGVVLGGRSRNGAHVLLRLDDLPPMKSYAERFTFRGLATGTHRIVAELRRADGEPFDPPSSALVTFDVTADQHRGSEGAS